MRMKGILMLGVLSFGAAFPADAQQYEARRNGDIVQLEDKKNQTIGVHHHVRRQLWPTR